MLKAGDLWYYRTKRAVIGDVAYPNPVKLQLISFNHLNQTATQYVHIFDLDKIPNNGAEPLIELTVAPKGMASYTPSMGGRKFENGLVAVLSSTPEILTKVATAELTYQAEGVIA